MVMGGGVQVGVAGGGLVTVPEPMGNVLLERGCVWVFCMIWGIGTEVDDIVVAKVAREELWKGS